MYDQMTERSICNKGIARSRCALVVGANINTPRLMFEKNIEKKIALASHFGGVFFCHRDKFGSKSATFGNMHMINMRYKDGKVKMCTCGRCQYYKHLCLK